MNLYNISVVTKFSPEKNEAVFQGYLTVEGVRRPFRKAAIILQFWLVVAIILT